ncbi:MucB/RseB C-terminal domain-containing protein [Kineobactrum sediminis]|uniref:MucB/RseB C-terminal domain-containing protein n=1 Tax=Kineobactrum sediminis TaxID=1905677 RepID=UPI001F4EF0E5|nr:MucB/RseB C-terminal domain-containing protein [Kineobactrum sediminis]
MLTTAKALICGGLVKASLLLSLILVPLLAPLGVAATCTDADREALAWLAKMSRSHHQQAYHGVITLQRGDDMQVMQVVHSVADGHISERLTRLTGQGAQVIRAGHPLDCRHPGQHILEHNKELASASCELARYYRFQMVRGERIAGRQAVKMHVQPRDLYRYGHVLELDRETGLLLRNSTIGAGDKLLERFQFADIAYGESPVTGIDIDIVHPAQHPRATVDKTAGPETGPAWSVKWLPGGFQATDEATGQDQRRTYTDGLAVFSVFLETLPRPIQPGEGVVREGSTISYTRGMRLAKWPVLVTVIGEVPLNTARMVADSIRAVP